MKTYSLRVLALVALPSLLACASTPADNGPTGGKGGSSSSNGSGGASNSSGSGGSSSGSGGSGGTSSGSDSGPAATACGTCPCPGEMLKNGLVSDFNDLMGTHAGLDANALSTVSNWTMDKDASTTCTPTLKAEDSTDATQKGAAHFSGSGCTGWGADIAVSFGTKPADATGYTALSFKIKGGATNAATSVLLKVELADAIPACGLCIMTKPDMSDCYAGFVLDGNKVTTDWTTVTVPFSSLKVAQWGYHAGTTFDPTQIFALSIAVPLGVAWDLWVDDIQFVK